MTGATITPRGVANSLNIAVEFLSEKGVMWNGFKNEKF